MRSRDVFLNKPCTKCGKTFKKLSKFMTLCDGCYIDALIKGQELRRKKMRILRSKRRQGTNRVYEVRDIKNLVKTMTLSPRIKTVKLDDQGYFIVNNRRTEYKL